MLTFKEYQARTKATDQRPAEDRQIHHYLIPLLGLFGEIGTVAAEYKKRLRDKKSYNGYRDKLSEELGDVLWYLSTIANDMNLNLETIAQKNLQKTIDRWPNKTDKIQTIYYDSEYSENEQLPRLMKVDFSTDETNKVRMVINGEPVGSSLSDNSHIDDGYRFHDVFHLSYAANLGWSPVLRALLHKKRKSNAKIDEVEDGARACIIEEAVSALIYDYAEKHNYLESVDSIDYEFLKTIKSIVGNLEVCNASSSLWEKAIIDGFLVFRQLRSLGSGTVEINIETKKIELIK
ncbi:nucleoside triphosphate pyrophosphohydrolase family protein [Fibrella forsythiae]|uniref:Nucleoside triphosphate pyrophosphohydrolase family protein n=1 Tax=Fibrella forsythiae TaxID=2817061 RepID=A0ABS3JST2_9BACT|nr:nucleoside triphosphate pyrophosphohydrolase family protein [Fibrella forsythiae]MBO0953074.1 nucleoside triphosphate pyrophosphohydrolase family protein [Fibrella forsythiae]